MIGVGVAAKGLHGARVCVIPRPENNYQPLILRRGPLATVSALLIGIKVLALGAVLVTPLPAELSTITTERIVQLTNVEREELGLPALTINAELSRAAAAKAKHMLEEDYFAHISPDGVTPWFWMQKENYVYQVAGENLAIDFVQAEDVVAAWMASPSHRENIVHSEYVETGVAALTGEYQGGTSTVVVHMFGLSVSQEAPPAAEVQSIEVVASVETPAPPAPILEAIVSGEKVRDTILLRITSDPKTAVAVLANNRGMATVQSVTGEPIEVEVELKTIEDGEVILQAYATGENNLKSTISAPIKTVKDTKAPTIGREALAFLVLPNTDQPRVAMHQLKDGAAKWISAPLTNQPLVASFYDELGNESKIENINLSPAFFTDRDTTYLAPPARFSQIVRRVALGVSIIILILLGLAIVIRVRIQHPRMITHTSLALLLAGIIFWL